MRMHADRARHVRKALRNGENLGVALHRVEIVTMWPTPAPSARATIGVELRGEVREIEMAVTIDKHLSSNGLVRNNT